MKTEAEIISEIRKCLIDIESIKTKAEIISEIRKSLIAIEQRVQSHNRMCTNIRSLAWTLEETGAEEMKTEAEIISEIRKCLIDIESIKTKAEIISEIRKSLIAIEQRVQPHNRMCTNIRSLAWTLEET